MAGAAGFGQGDNADPNDLLEEMLRSAEQELVPEIKRKLRNFVLIINHPHSQDRIQTEIEQAKLTAEQIVSSVELCLRVSSDHQRSEDRLYTNIAQVKLTAEQIVSEFKGKGSYWPIGASGPLFIEVPGNSDRRVPLFFEYRRFANPPFVLRVGGCDGPLAPFPNAPLSVFTKFCCLKEVVDKLRNPTMRTDADGIFSFLFSAARLGFIEEEHSHFIFLSGNNLHIEERVDLFWKFYDSEIPNVGSRTREENRKIQRSEFQTYIQQWKLNRKRWEKDQTYVDLEAKAIETAFEHVVNKNNPDVFEQLKFVCNPLGEKLSDARRKHNLGAEGTSLQNVGAKLYAATVLPSQTYLGEFLHKATENRPYLRRGIKFGLKKGLGIDTEPDDWNKLAETEKELKKGIKRCTDDGWYERVETDLMNFLKGYTSEWDLHQLIVQEALEDDLDEISSVLDPWIKKLRDDLEFYVLSKETGFALHPFKLSESLMLMEVDRSFKLLQAVILNTRTSKENYMEFLKKFEYQIANTRSASVLPVILFGNAKSKRTVCLQFILDSSIDEHTAVKNTLIKLEEILRKDGVTAQPKTEDVLKTDIRTENGITFIEMDIEFPDHMANSLARALGKLADVHVRGVLVGEFGMAEFPHAMNPAHNRIYSRTRLETATGFTPTSFTCLTRGKEPYYYANGWRRYAVNVGLTAQQFEEKYRDWPVAYHGTKKDTVVLILQNGLLASKQGCYFDDLKLKGAVYMSPSIEYCGHRRYSELFEFTQKETSRKKYAQMVLQVRVDRKLVFDKKPETLLRSRFEQSTIIDPNFKNCELEWVLRSPPGGYYSAFEGILVYGIMFRVSDVPLEELPQNAWWEASVC